MALVLFVCVAGMFRLRSTDVFWHLAAGRWILEHAQIPTTDPFRFSSGGAPWVDHEWLFQVIIRGVELAGGVFALVLFRSLLALVLTAVLYRGLRQIGTNVVETVLLVLFSVLGARPRFLLRPEIFTLIALSLLLVLLRRFVIEGRWRWVAAMAVLSVGWVNLHGEALLAPVVAGLYLVGAGLQDSLLRKQERSDDKPRLQGIEPWARAIAVPALLALCLLANPYGWHVFGVPLGITGAMYNLAAYNPEWVPLWVAPQPFLFTGFVTIAALTVVGLVRTRRLHLPTTLVALTLGAVSMSAVRHQALFFIGAAFLGAETLAGLARPGTPLYRQRPQRASVFATSACILSLAWSLFPPSAGPLRPRQGRFTPGLGIEPHRFPEKAASFLSQHPEIGPLYNTFAHGGYLLWRLYPPRQVFHDGRMELQPGLLREIGRARSNNRNWNELLRHYGAVGALVRYDERPRPVLQPNPESGELEFAGYRTSHALLFPPEDYALVYWDDLVMLFLARSSSQPEEVMAGEYLFVQPEDLAWTLSRAEDAEFRQGCLREVERKLRDDPATQRAIELRDKLLL